MGATPESLTAIAQRVDGCLESVLDGEVRRWEALDGDLSDPVNEVLRLVRSGGKRLRPAFCHWGFVAAGGDDGEMDEAVVASGAALELLHAQALFHDDVIDDSDSRRGAPTAHRVFTDRHRSAGWLGESRRFGDGMAILIGDLAGVFADRLMTGVPSETKAIWDEMRIEVNLGQMLDVLGSASGDRTIERAERVCRYKSAKYSIERPLHLGASLRGASDQVMQALSAYGLPLGEAFQMRDDVMGVFGDPEVTGKPVGDDLREAKPTPLVARAVARADRSQAEVLRMIGQADLTPSDISSIQEVIIATGALDELEGAIDDRVRRAVDALDGVISAQAVAPLTELASFIVDRAN